MRLITPQTPRPAPIATTRVCRIFTAEVKNAIDCTFHYSYVVPFLFFELIFCICFLSWCPLSALRRGSTDRRQYVFFDCISSCLRTCSTRLLRHPLQSQRLPLHHRLSCEADSTYKELCVHNCHDEIEGIIGVGDDNEHCRFLISQHIQFHFVICHQVTKLLNVKRR